MKKCTKGLPEKRTTHATDASASCEPKALKTLCAALLMALFSVVTLLLEGCRSAPLITVELLNRTGGACPTASIVLNGKSVDLPANVPNGNASDTSDYWPNPMPATATLLWVTEDGVKHSVTLPLPPPPSHHTEFLDYEIAILPGGIAKSAVVASSGDSDAEVNRQITITDALCCNGGPNYRVAVKNKTGETVDNLYIRFGPYAVNAGTHLDHSGQDFSIATGLPYPITNSASVNCVTSDGRAWAKAIDISTVLPPDINNKCFWFILNERGDVRVQIVGWDDLRAGKYPELCHGF